MISPFDRVPERGLDCFFVATEACCGRTSNLGLFLGVYEYIGFLGIDFTRRWATRWAQYTRARQGAWRALVGCAHLVALLALTRSV